MDKKSLERLNGHLCKCEENLIAAGDVGYEVVLDGGDPAKKFAEMHAAVRSARERLDEAHEVLAEMRNNGGDDELAFTPARRKSELHELDRTDVGSSRVQPIRDIGGAHLALEIQADAQRRLNEYWGWSR